MPCLKDQVTLVEMPLKDIKVYEVHFEVNSMGSADNCYVISHFITLYKMIKDVKDIDHVRNAR